MWEKRLHRSKQIAAGPASYEGLCSAAAEEPRRYRVCYVRSEDAALGVHTKQGRFSYPPRFHLGAFPNIGVAFLR